MDAILDLISPVQVPSQYQSQVKITNVLSLIFSVVTMGIFLIFYSLFGWLDTLLFIVLVAVFFILVIPINRAFSHRVGRVIFCLIPVWLTMFVTIYFKMENPVQTDILYFDSRFILMATVILPGIVFRLEERLQMFICLGSSFFLAILFDPIHSLFGVGYYQMGFDDPTYYYINYIVAITTGVILFGILLIRSVLEKSESELLSQNRLLSDKQHEIEAQHEELLVSSEKLTEANAIVSKQKQELEKYNASLEALVNEKSDQLIRTNDELVKHNNELIQFSYTISHNLRGPVARLLGLIHLIKSSESDSPKSEIVSHLAKTTTELDGVLRDLGRIVSGRNELHALKEEIDLENEFRNVMMLLADNITPPQKFVADFSEVPTVFSVRPMIQTILFQLLSNTIRYQAMSRPLLVQIRSRKIDSDKIQLEISDNAVGIDLERYHEKIFRPFMRFHDHVNGKGLGLYMVKTQVDALGGDITVKSRVDKGTTFSVVLPK